VSRNISHSVLKRLSETEPNLVEDAVKYIIFLVDAEKLFDTALGMYDFSLVLLIAQHSQKVNVNSSLGVFRVHRDVETNRIQENICRSFGNFGH